MYRGFRDLSPPAIGILCGTGAFLVGAVCTVVASVHWSHGSGVTNDGSVRELGVRFYLAHRVDVAVHEQDVAVWLNVDWWSFAYVHQVAPMATTTDVDSVIGYATTSAYTFSPAAHDLVSQQFFAAPVFAIPPLVLLGAGAVASLWFGATTLRQAGLAGTTIVFGYFPLTVLGVHLVGAIVVDDRIPGGTYLLFPDPIVATVRMGVVYPMLFGAVGGATASVIRRRLGGRGRRASTIGSGPG